jgi:hypothetical protein
VNIRVAYAAVQNLDQDIVVAYSSTMKLEGGKRGSLILNSVRFCWEHGGVLFGKKMERDGIVPDSNGS